MGDNCTHDCGSCGENCSERKIDKSEFLVKPHVGSNIKKVIGIVSGKGGVGKSLVTSLLAVAANNKNYKTAILDADITGPSIPKSFGIKTHAMSDGESLLPVKTNKGISVMSLNLLTENETDPVIWRGPIIAGTVKQFWSDVIWGDVDYMFVDMPPGTGDVPLTVFQSLPLDGIIIVLSPQELVSMIVEKAVKMANLMDVPVLGIVENMSYILCPDCSKKIFVFGESKVDEIADRYGINNISKIPLNPEISSLCDDGNIENIKSNDLDELFNSIINQLK